MPLFQNDSRFFDGDNRWCFPLSFFGFKPLTSALLQATSTVHQDVFASPGRFRMPKRRCLKGSFLCFLWTVPQHVHLAGRTGSRCRSQAQTDLGCLEDKGNTGEGCLNEGCHCYPSLVVAKDPYLPNYLQRQYVPVG